MEFCDLGGLSALRTSAEWLLRPVTTDISCAYYAATLKNLPNAKHDFDRFHIVKLMNEKLPQLRRDLQNEADTMGREALKGLRWLLLKFEGGSRPRDSFWPKACFFPGDLGGWLVLKYALVALGMVAILGWV